MHLLITFKCTSNKIEEMAKLLKKVQKIRIVAVVKSVVVVRRRTNLRGILSQKTLKILSCLDPKQKTLTAKERNNMRKIQILSAMVTLNFRAQTLETATFTLHTRKYQLITQLPTISCPSRPRCTCIRVLTVTLIGPTNLLPKIYIFNKPRKHTYKTLI